MPSSRIHALRFVAPAPGRWHKDTVPVGPGERYDIDNDGREEQDGVGLTMTVEVRVVRCAYGP